MKSQNAARLNIFTCANQAYEDFAPLFALSCLWSNPDATIEIGLEDVVTFMHEHGAAMQPVFDAAPDGKITLRSVSFRDGRDQPILPNSVRFLVPPARRSSYVYITDIDIIMLSPNVRRKHLRHMCRTGLPFSNMVRRGTARLTGLHFTKYDAFYPIPDCSDLDLGTLNDEVLLYKLVQRRLGSITISGARYRPVHGIHISPNRQALGDGKIPGWGIHPYEAAWKKFRRCGVFARVEPFLSKRVTDAIAGIDASTL